MASDEDRLTQIVRECVRNEMALQRSGSGSNASLLSRTRNLISNAARSASREAAGAPSPAQASFEAEAEVPTRAQHSGGFQTGKRPASTWNHPWRFKKGKSKNVKQEFHPKAIHVLEKPEYDLLAEEGSYVPDYAVNDNMILLKGYIELGTGQSEREIRQSITDVLKQRFPFLRPEHFDFVKRERNKVTTPVVSKSLEWNYKQVRELCGQGKLYIRLNVPRECIELTIEPSADRITDEELLESPFSSERAFDLTTEEPVGQHNSYTSQASDALRNHASQSSIPGPSTGNRANSANRANTEDVNEPGPSRASDMLRSQASQSSIPGPSTGILLSDQARLRELIPSASDEDLESALLQHGSLDSAANALLQEECHITGAESLAQIISALGQKLTGTRKKLDVDEDDLVGDAVAYYKSLNFDACRPLRISYQGQPAIDSGGVLRQFYSDLFEGLVGGKLMLLFEGDSNCKVPSYQPQAVLSGMFEMVGKMIAHSLAQGGPGFPCLALPCFYYLVTGDVMCAFAYCDFWDVPDSSARNVVSQVCPCRSLASGFSRWYLFL